MVIEWRHSGIERYYASTKHWEIWVHQTYWRDGWMISLKGITRASHWRHMDRVQKFRTAKAAMADEHLLNFIEAFESIDAEEWQQLDMIYTEVERVYATRIDCCTGRQRGRAA